MSRVELANRERYADQTAGRNDGCDPTSVGQPRVEDRLRFRDVVAETPRNVLDCNHQSLVAEGDVLYLPKEPILLDEYVVGAIHHDFADRIVEDEVFNWS